MQFSESWLRTFCNPAISTAELAETLTMAGLEVEELKPVAPPFTKIVVGEIKEAQQHPNADRLRVCKVDVGQTELLNIVCGAPNARVGIRIPCALVGAELPPGEDGKPFQIKVGQLRGVESQGMLCSARELKLSEDHGGLLELPSDAPLGQDIRSYLDLDDTLFTLKLTPNLAHCLSVYGVAREVSAMTVWSIRRTVSGFPQSVVDTMGEVAGEIVSAGGIPAGPPTVLYYDEEFNKGEGGADDEGEAEFRRHGAGFLHVVGQAGAGQVQADGGHGVAEELPDGQ